MVWKRFRQSGEKFFNPHLSDTKRGFVDVCLWGLGHYHDSLNGCSPDEKFIYPAKPRAFDSQSSAAVWIGHSTFLIKVAGIVFLTDPVFSSYCSPVPIRGLKRNRQPAISLENLPPIDCILISHNHYDHLDERSVRWIHKRYPQAIWIVPQGVKKWFSKRKIERVHEIIWGENCSLNDSCTITSVPAQHFSGRGIWDKDRTLWCGYVVACGEKRFYFVGDTGYNPFDFKEIGCIWSSMDLSLIPIGAYAPRGFMRPVHINPEEAVCIHQDVHSRLSLGMHWKTFRLSEEGVDLPPYDLFLAMQKYGLPFETFLPVDPGVYVNW